MKTQTTKQTAKATTKKAEPVVLTKAGEKHTASVRTLKVPAAPKVSATPPAPAVVKAAVAQKPAKTAKAPKVVDPENKRITPGTPTKEWRVRRSARVSLPGVYFVQGGEYREDESGRHFFVGVEEAHGSLEAARARLAVLAPKAKAA